MGKFRKLSVVLLLAFVLLCCCAVSAFAVDHYSFEVNFYDSEDDAFSTPISYIGHEPLYGYVEVIDNETHEEYWSYQPLQEEGVSWTATLSNFWSAEEDPKGEGPTSYSYNSEQCTVKENSYRVYVEEPTYETVHSEDPNEKPNDTISGYEFKGNVTTDPNNILVRIKKSKYAKAFILRLDFDPKFSTSVNQNDLYYILITVTHDTTKKTYELIPWTTDRTDPQVYQISQWKDSNGIILQNEKFTGNEQGVTVELIKAKKIINYNNAIAKTDCVAIAAGGAVKDYSISYDSDWTTGIPNPYLNSDTQTDEYRYTITLSKIAATDDYSFKSILGPGLYFGITADTFDQKNHIQSNFATNLYKGNGNIVEADLASNMGAIIMSDAEPDSGHYIDIGQSNHGGKVLIYTDKPEQGLLKNERNFVTVITSTKQDLKDHYVDPIINYGETISNQLIQHPATITPDIGHQNKVLIDTSAFPDDATIYIEADDLAAAGDLEAGNLLIKKKEGQLLVFNLDEAEKSGNLSIGQFYVQYPDMSKYAVQEGVTVDINEYPGKWISSSTPTEPGDKNNALDEITRHIVWNCNSVTTLELDDTAGMFLVPTDNSHTNIGSTSSGWIITGGTFQNTGGEWHFNYQDLNDIDEANLTLKKTVNGITPTAADKFEFKIERYNKETQKWEVLDDAVENEGSLINYTLNKESENLSDGWNAYKITETRVSENNNTGKIYTISQASYFAAVNYQTIGTTKIASIPKYYQIFDETTFNTNAADGATEELVGFSEPVYEPVFDNEAHEFANLKVTKDIEGKDWGDDEFTFTIEAVSATDPDTHEEISSIPMPQKTTAKATPEDHIAVFGSVIFEKSGIYIYKIKEIPPEGAVYSDDGKTAIKDNITYDITEHLVTVNVSVNDDNKLEAVVDYGSGDEKLIVTNSFAFTEEVSEQLEAKKYVEGRNAPAEDFTFVLTPANANAQNPAKVSFESGVEGDASAPQQITIAGATVTNPVTGKFEKIIYHEPGEYKYTITEEKGDTDSEEAAYLYDDSIYVVTINITNAGTVTKTIQKTDSKGNPIDDNATDVDLVNRFVTNKLYVQKVWLNSSGEDISSTKTGTIRYKLKQIATRKPIETKTVNMIWGKYGDTDGAKITEDLQLGTVVTLTVNNENEPAVRKYSNDGSFYNNSSVVTLFSHSENNWIYLITIESDISIEVHTNNNDTTQNDITYAWTEQEDISGVQPTEKNFPDNDFSYILNDQNNWTDYFTIVQASDPVTNNYQLPKEGTTEEGKEVTYTYKVVEVDEQGTEITDNVTYTNNNGILRRDIYIKNTEATDSVEITLSGSKTFNHPATVTPPTFTYTLKEGSEIIEEQTTNGAGNYAFTINYSTAENHIYTIVETIPCTSESHTCSGVIYDTNEYTVTVNVSPDDTGKLTASVSAVNTQGNSVASDNLNFTNSYTASGPITLQVRKAVTPWPSTPGKFTFWLKPDTVNGVMDGNAARVITENGRSVEVTNSETSFSFTPINFAYSDIGQEFKFIVYEDIPSNAETVTIHDVPHKVKDHIVYDETQKHIVIIPRDNGDGTIRAEVTGANYASTDAKVFSAGTFSNSHYHEGSATFGITKNTNKLSGNPEYSFKLEGVSPAAIQKIGPSGMTQRLTPSEASTDVNFIQIRFTEDDFNEDGTAKDFIFKVSEVIPEEAKNNGNKLNGIQYDPTVYQFKVELTENSDDTITATVSVINEDGTETEKTVSAGVFRIGTFTNTYTAEGSVKLSVAKSINPWPNVEDVLPFRFKMVPDGNTKIDQDGIIAEISENNTQGTFTPITFSSVDIGKDFKFKITEVYPSDAENVNIHGVSHKVKNGIVYDETPISITISPEDQGDGTIIPKVYIDDSSNSAQFTVDPITPKQFNVYIGSFTNTHHDEGTVQFSVTKNLGNWPQTIDSIQFKIEADDNTETAASNAYAAEKLAVNDYDPFASATSENTTAVFQAIKFTTEDDLDKNGTPKEFTFKISEVIPEGAEKKVIDGAEQWVKNGVVFSETPIKVRVTLTDNYDGTITPSVYLNGSTTPEQNKIPYNVGTITNTYRAESSAVLTVTKSITPWPANPNFTFRLKPVNDFAKTKIAEQGITSIVSSENNPIAKFAEITFDQSDIDHSFTFIVTEDAPVGCDEEVINGTTYKVKDGIVYSKETIRVTITPRDNHNGTISPCVTVDTETACRSKTNVNEYSTGTITNTHHDTGKLQFSTSKSINFWPAGKEYFEFKLTAKNTNALAKLPNPVIKQAGSVNTPVDFDIISFEDDDVFESDGKNKEFTFALEEVVPEDAVTVPGTDYKEKDGIKYSTKVVDITVTLTNNYDGTISPHLEVKNGSYTSNSYRFTIGSFINEYHASAKLQLSAGKSFDKWEESGAGKFTIKLEADPDDMNARAKLPSAVEKDITSASDPAEALFDVISFTEADHDQTFKFIISEVKGNVSGVVYSEVKYNVEVKPTDYGNGTMILALKVNDESKIVSPEDGIYRLKAGTFENTYVTGTAKLEVIKALGSNSNWPEGKNVEFTLEGLNGALMPEGSTGQQKVVTVQSAGDVNFGTITYPYTGPEMIGKTYEYEITETKGFGDGWTVAPSKITATVTIVKDNGDGTLKTEVTYSPEGQTFTNTYETKGSLILSATKAFNRWDMVDSFTFKLETNNQDLVDQQTVSKSSPIAEFKQIDFSKFDDGKERTFTISEVIPENPIAGITYAEPIVISVTPVDNGDGTMTLYSSGQALSKDENGVCKLNVGTLTNTYHSAGTGVIRVAKVLEGREWSNDDTNTFTLEAVDGAPTPGNNSVTITKDTEGRTAAFDEIPFSEPGTYEYIVKETKGNVKGIIYDETVKTVTFKVERNEKGEIVATADSSLVQDVSFTNTYNATGRLRMKSSKTIAGAPDGSAQSHELPFELWHKADHEKFKAGDTTVEPLISRVITILDNETLEFNYPVDFTLESDPDLEQPENPHDVIHVESLPDAVKAGKAVMKMAGGKRVYTVNYVLDERTVVDRELNPPDQTYDIIVEIEDEGDGTLHVNSLKYKDINKPGEDYTEVTDPAADIMIGTFLNRERHDSVTELLIGTKILEGRDLTTADNGKWFVTISSDDENAPLPQEKTVPVVIKEENGNLRGSFTFGAITFEPEHMGECIPDAVKGYICGSKDYHYTLTESGTEEGIINGSALKFIIRASEGENGHVQADFVDEAGNILTMQQVLAELTLINRTAEQEKTPEGPTFYRIRTMPETGFSALKPTVLSEQPKALNYKPLAWMLEIPSLDLVTDIVEVPSTDGTYPVTWLGSSAGLLEGFGLPGSGHSVLTGHNHLNTMEAGPFALLQEMGIGDRIFVLDPQNEMQIFTVYANEKITETDIRGLQRIAERFDDSLTLITCEDERVEGGYANRRIIAAKPVN